MGKADDTSSGARTRWLVQEIGLAGRRQAMPSAGRAELAAARHVLERRSGVSVWLTDADENE